MHQGNLRIRMNQLLARIAFNRKYANTTTNSKLWSKTMHKLKALRVALKRITEDLRQMIYSDRGHFDLYGKMTECLVISKGPFKTRDIRSTVDGKYYRVQDGTNKGYSLC